MYKMKQYADENSPAQEREYDNKPRVKNIYLDHVCRNDTNQTAPAVCSIIELVCRNVRAMLPSLKHVVVQTDNAENYNNRMIPLMAPFIFRQYGMKLNRFIHSETQDGEGPADGQFAVAMRHVDKYIAENELGVVTPTDLVRAINHGQRMKGCIGELFDVDNECNEAKKWISATKSKRSEDGLAELDRVNEVRYQDCTDGDGSIMACTYIYKYSDPLKWKFEIGKSKYVGGAQFPASLENGNEVDADCIVRNDCREEAPLFDVVDLANESAATEVIFTGCITGAKLITSSYVKGQSIVDTDRNKYGGKGGDSIESSIKERDR